jgi:hypothetical protein
MSRCIHCHGRLAPDYFMVPSIVWKFYVAPKDQRKHLCLRCYRVLVDSKDSGTFEREHGKPALLVFGERFLPIPDGGTSELSSMSDRKKNSFFHHARAIGYWNWLKDPGKALK